MPTVYGTPGNDVISAADSGADTIYGLAGDDQLYAPKPGGSDDSFSQYFLDGGDGNDFIYGRGAAIRAHGGTGNDRFDLVAESVRVFGGVGDDEIDVGADGGAVYGDDGNDLLTVTIFPNPAIIDGGAGHDTIIVDNFGDSQADVRGGSGNDRIVATQDEIDAKGGDGADTLIGSNSFEFGDRLYGNAGNDRISGQGGSDKIGPGYGIDMMSGGRGNDLFDINTGDSGVGAGNRDIITDFVSGSDDIDVISIDAKAGVDGNQAFSFIGRNAFTAAGQLRFKHADGSTLVQGSVDGDTQAEFELQLAGTVTPTAADFLL